MRRDNDLIRKLMLRFEDSPHLYISARTGEEMGFHYMANDLSEVENTEYGHILLLAEDGMVEFHENGRGAFRITSKGHDFIEAIRDDTIWKKTKEAALKVSGVTLPLLAEIATGYIRQELTKLGIPLG